MNEAIQGLVAGESGGPTGQALYTLFQPIIDGATREPIGHEALTRGPEGPLELPAALIAAAAAAGLSIPLERCCLESALRAYRSLGLQGRLFLNLLPQNLLDWAGLADWLGGSSPPIRSILTMSFSKSPSTVSRKTRCFWPMPWLRCARSGVTSLSTILARALPG